MSCNDHYVKHLDVITHLSEQLKARNPGFPISIVLIGSAARGTETSFSEPLMLGVQALQGLFPAKRRILPCPALSIVSVAASVRFPLSDGLSRRARTRLSGTPSLSSTRITVTALGLSIAVVDAEPLGNQHGCLPQGHALNVRNQVKLVAAGVAVAETLPSARRGHRKRSLARAADWTAAGIALSGAFEVLAPTVAKDDSLPGHFGFKNG